MSSRFIALACVVGAVTAPGWGQSINIDFGDGSGAPPPGYAGAGLPGTWNVITKPLDKPVALVGLDRPTFAGHHPGDQHLWNAG